MKCTLTGACFSPSASAYLTPPCLFSFLPFLFVCIRTDTMDGDIDNSNDVQTVEHTKVIEISKKIVTFRVTPVMSSYLLGFSVGEFDVLEQTVKMKAHG